MLHKAEKAGRVEDIKLVVQKADAEKEPKKYDARHQ